MSSPKKNPNDDYEAHSLKSCACAPSVADTASKGAIPKGIPSFPGKMLCVGHDFGRQKKKKLEKPKFPSQEGWMSYKEALALQEKKLRKMMQERIRFRSFASRYNMALKNRLDLTHLDERGVRRFRFPCTVFIPAELEEDGYPLSAAIVRGFIHYNDNMKMLAVSGSAFYDEPPLSEKPEMLRKVANALTKVEEAGKKDPPDRALQIDSLLEMAFHFLNQGETVAWIVEKVLLVAIDMASDYPRDGYKSEALSRFAYGCFLQNFQLYDHAIQELEIARNITLGKTWEIEYEYDKKYDSLQQEVSDVLCRVFLVMARKVRAKNPYQTVRYCSRALRRLGDKALIEVESEALLELGLGYKEAGNYVMAEQAFLEYLRRYSNSSNAAGICTAYLEGALCYSHLGNVEKAQEFLYYVLEAADKSGLDELTAIAQRYIGESFLKMGFFKESSHCLEDSFKTYIKIKKHKVADELRILAGISKGMEIIPKMADLLNACIDDSSGIHFLQLLKWRFYRTPFWDVTADDAPKMPDSTLYTCVEDDDRALYIIGDSRVSVNEMRQAFAEYISKRKYLEERYLSMFQKRMEETGYEGAYYEAKLPGYQDEEVEQDEHIKSYRPDMHTIAGGYEIIFQDVRESLLHIPEEIKHSDTDSLSYSSSLSYNSEETSLENEFENKVAVED